MSLPGVAQHAADAHTHNPEVDSMVDHELLRLEEQDQAEESREGIGKP
jgi:hypothetical protein